SDRTAIRVRQPLRAGDADGRVGRVSPQLSAVAVSGPTVCDGRGAGGGGGGGGAPWGSGPPAATAGAAESKPHPSGADLCAAAGREHGRLVERAGEIPGGIAAGGCGDRGGGGGAGQARRATA